MSSPVIAVDGPAGSGKSTVSRALATRLGVRHIDTGAMYRALAVKILDLGMDPFGESDVIGMLEGTEIQVADGRVLLDGRDVTGLIRTGEVTRASSKVAQLQPVRKWMVSRQRELVSAANGAVVEGRDIGTVVLPEARLKVFLTANEKERTRRRSLQTGASNEATVAEIADRDARDSTRIHSPLKAADDAMVLDTTDLSEDEVVARIIEFLSDLGELNG